MGVTTFLQRLETTFINQLLAEHIPRGLDPTDGPGVKSWFKEAFGFWWLERRNELLGREWVKRGWAEYVVAPDGQGGFVGEYRVRPEHVRDIDAWLEDHDA